MEKINRIFTSFFITVCVYVIPTTCLAPPVGLRAIVVSPNAFRIKWVENFRNNPKSSLYTLRYRALSGEDLFKYVDTTKTEVKRLNVATSNGSYEFSVKAVRDLQESDWSEPVLKSLDSDMRVGQPRGLKVKDVSETDIKIKWRRPKSRRQSISGYRVTLKLVGTKITTLKHVTERTLQLSNLKPGSTYIIRVQTLSEKGFLSQPAKITVRTKRKVILAPPGNFTVIVYGSTKLLVTWTEDPDDTKVTGYQIQYRQKGVQKGTLCTVVTTKKKQKYVITDLYKGQQYKVRMAAKSGQLTGKYTEWIVVMMSGGKNKKETTTHDVNNEKYDDDDDDEEDDGTPGHVDPTSDIDRDMTEDNHSGILSVDVNKTDHTFEGQNVTFTCAVRYHGNADISTTWTKGSDLRFDRIGAWFIEITGRHKLIETTFTEGNVTAFVSKLTLFKLRTTDSGGYTCHVLNSDQSAAVFLKVTDASPGPPKYIEAEVLSHNSIGVYWSPPENSEGFPITYELLCWRDRKPREYDYKHIIIKNITETEYIIRSLQYDTKYHIGVVAVNQFGRSSFRQVENVTATTLDLPPLDISDIRIANHVVEQDGWNQNENGVSLDNDGDTNLKSKTAVMITIAWDKRVIDSWPMKWTQHIIHYKTDDNNTIHQKSVWKNSTVINNLDDDKLYYFRVETVFPGKSIYSPWKKFSTFLTERTVPPPPRDMFLNILTNESMVIKWLPPPEEYRVRIRNYQLQVAEDDGRRSYFRIDRTEREFIVPSIDLSKTYTVELSAVNSVGHSDSVVRIVDAFGDSSEVIHLIARPVTSRSIRVSWTAPPSVTNLTRYLLRHRAVNANIIQPKDLFLLPTATQFYVDGLQEHTEYLVSLIPYINDVPGNLTSTTAWTLTDVPSAPPKAVHVQNINVSSFLVSWEPPPEYTRNGKLIFYRVEYRTKNDMTSKNMLVPAGKNELLLTDLKAGAVYEMRVGAVTVNGTGPFSSWVQLVVTGSGIVIEGPPEAPTNLTAVPVPEGISLSWSPPDNASIPVSGYIVGHGRFIAGVYRKILGPSDTEYTINGLRPNARYILTVRAFNSYGESKPVLIKARSGKKLSIFQTTQEMTTPTTTPIPGAPYDIRIGEQSSEVPTAMVTWKRPAIPDQIRGYILLYTNNSSLPLYEWTGVFERSLQYVIKNLSFNTTYFVRIQTQLSDGTGVMSPTKYFTTRAAAKSKGILPKPKFVSAFSGPDNIQISWQPPDYAYIIRGYILGYGIEQPGEYQEMLPFSETSFTIKRLAPGTEYHISLRSFGEFGESEKAVISVSTTG